MSSKITYRQQFTRCGKERCRKCKEGTGHGPYWYAYWSENGHTVSKYIGIHPPAHVELERLATEQMEGAEDGHEGTLGRNQSTLPNTGPVNRAMREAGYTQEVPLQLNTHVLRIYVLGQFRVDC